LTSPTVYFGALVAGARVIWFDAERALLVCRCGGTFLAYRSGLIRTHRAKGVTGCLSCQTQARSNKMRAMHQWATSHRELFASFEAAT
jgi:hypothetical protein